MMKAGRGSVLCLFLYAIRVNFRVNFFHKTVLSGNIFMLSGNNLES